MELNHETQCPDEMLELFRKQETFMSVLLKAFSCTEEITSNVMTSARKWLEGVFLKAKSEYELTFFDPMPYFNQKRECLQASHASLVAIACGIISYKFETGLHWRFSEVVDVLKTTMKSEDVAPVQNDMTWTMASSGNSYEGLRIELLKVERKVLEWKGLIRCVSKKEGKVPWHWECEPQQQQTQSHAHTTPPLSPATALLICHEKL